MKALVIDGATQRLTIAAKNDDKIFTAIYDIGMKQSETLIPAIDFALSKVDVNKSELDYTALCVGPGSFTGLRLTISALKAIELAFNVPVYGLSTLEIYAYPFVAANNNIPVLSAIDANKDKFYAAIYNSSAEISLEEGDYETEFLVKKTEEFDTLVITGPDSLKLKAEVMASNKTTRIISAISNFNTTEALFAVAEKKLAARIQPLQDYDGPVYLRASEAEIKHNQN